MKITSSIYVLPGTLLLAGITALCAVDDPCPHNIDNNIVADMCTDDQAVEDSVNSSNVTNSVVVRVTKQNANCTCRVSLRNIQASYTVYMRKWSALKNSAPEFPHCGLAIDVNYLKSAEKKRSSYPIQCSTGTSQRTNILQKNEFIELNSKIIDGTFTRGYCMQIYRNHQTRGPNVQLHIQCDDPDKKTTISTPHESVTTKYANQQISTDEMTLTTGTAENDEMSTVTTKGYNNERGFASITDTNDNHETSTVTTKGHNKVENDQNTNIYIYIGSGAGGVLVIIAMLVIILCRRKRSKKRTKTEKQTTHDSNDPDSDNGELKDNILYVSSDQQDIFEDGNYHMVDLEKKPVVNLGVLDNQTQHISTFDNSNNEYAVVDKGRQSDSDTHASTSEVKNSIEKNIEMSGTHVDQTYAVVDKTNRGRTDE